MGNLTLYNRKRDFTKTAEPAGKIARADTHRFLVQKHDATRLHYDFRLEWGGVLKSWAVTRGPSPNPEDKRLAVETEDHPLEYANFEGTIPAGEYGGGTVMLWDEGTWQPDGNPEAAYRKGHLRFTLSGKRMKGRWHLVRMAPRKKESRVNWLLVKEDDAFAAPQNGEDWVNAYDTSIRTRRTMAAIAGSGASWPEVKRARRNGRAVAVPAAAPKASMPDFIAPELAELHAEPPASGGWLHEIKLDGYRIQAHRSAEGLILYSRNGLNWTARFPTIAYGLEGLAAETAVLDGEVVVHNPRGASDFSALQHYLKGEDASAAPVYYVFDLLHLDGRDLRPLPLAERKALLKTLLDRLPEGTGIRYSEHLESKGGTVLDRACALSLEGIISKRADAPYRSGRSGQWVKSKCARRQEMVIGGYTHPSRGSRGVGALLLGYYDGPVLRYAGKVGTGFTADESHALRKRLEGMRIAKSPFDTVPGIIRRHARWVAPELVAEIAFSEWTGDGRLRHPSYQGLREDKPPAAVVREGDVPETAPPPPSKDAPGEDRPAEKAPSKNPPKPAQAGKRPVKARPAKARPAEARAVKPQGGSVTVGGVVITSPSRVVFPEAGITKQAVAEYYHRVAERLLPHVGGRPLSLLRCPDGQKKGCFFQRHRGSGLPAAVKRVTVEPGEAPYVMIDSAEGLLGLVQMGTLELHPWGARADAIDTPDRITFDLDPDDDVPWSWVQEAAAEIYTRLEGRGLASFLKASGGKGLHVVVPLSGGHGWDQVKEFARSLMQEMEQARPARYLTKMAKAQRKGRIFLDYLRNEKSATAIAPYSLRAREGAPIAVPLAWKDLFSLNSAHPCTLDTIGGYLEKPDPWQAMARVRQSL